MNRFARWIVKHRVAVVIICLLMLIPSVLGMNATKVKYDLLYYLPEDLDTVKGQNILMEEFGKGAFSLCITEGMSETDQQALEDAIRKGAKGLLKDVALFDIYTGVGIAPGKKSVAFNLTLRSDDRSLTAEEADADVKSILTALEQECGAVLR